MIATHNSFAKLLFYVLTLLALPGMAQEGDWQRVEKNGKVGLADANGKVVVPARYDALGWSDGSFSVLDGALAYRHGDSWGLVSTSGQEITHALYKQLQPGIAEQVIASKSVSKQSFPQFGVLSPKGKAIIGFRYRSINVTGNYYLLTDNEGGQLKVGLATTRGEITIPCQYKDIYALSGGTFAVTDYRNKVSTFTPQGQKLLTFELDSIRNTVREGWFLIYRRGKAGLINASGKLLVEPEYKKIEISPTGATTLVPFPVLELQEPGNSLHSTFVYDSVQPLWENRWVAYTGRQAWYITESDSLLYPRAWNHISTLSEHTLLVQQGTKMGVIGKGGEELLPCRFDSIVPGGAFFWAGSAFQGRWRWQLYDDVGHKLSKREYQEVGPMGERLFPVKREGLWGYLNTRGEEQIPCRYDAVRAFNNREALVKYLGRWGIINKDGDWIMRPDFEQLEAGHGTDYLRHAGFRSYLLRPESGTRVMTDSRLIKVPQGYMEDDRHGRYGFRDQGGEVVLPMIYDSLAWETDAVIYARKGDENGWFNLSGRRIFTLRESYQDFIPLEDGNFLIRSLGRWGMVNQQGEFQIANRYDSLRPFAEEMAGFMLIGHWGFIDKAERIAIQPNYDAAGDFRNGLAVVGNEGNFGLINLRGEVVLPLRYDAVSPQKNGTYLLYDEGKVGLADATGRQQVSPLYQSLEVAGPYLIAKYKGLYGVLKRDGLTALPIHFEALEYLPGREAFLSRKQQEPLFKTILD